MIVNKKTLKLFHLIFCSLTLYLGVDSILDYP